MRAADAAEQRARTDADQRTDKLLRDPAVVGLLFEPVGMYRLLLGTAFSTWPQETAALLRPSVP